LDKFVQVVHPLTSTHSLFVGTWYHVGHGHCIFALFRSVEFAKVAVVLFVSLTHQFSVISLFAQVYGLGSDEFHTKPNVSEVVFIVQAMVVDCCVTVQLLGKALFLHH
jgi:hypothetical protein